jgi:hypothetical protein
MGLDWYDEKDFGPAWKKFDEEDQKAASNSDGNECSSAGQGVSL